MTDLEKFVELAEVTEFGRQVVAEGRLLELRTKLGFSRKMMSELLHTSPLTYKQWEENQRTKLWPETARRISRFYSQAIQVLREVEAEGVILHRYIPFYMAAAHMAIPQELLLSRYRQGQFEALDLGILGLWMPKEYLNLEQKEDIR